MLGGTILAVVLGLVSVWGIERWKFQSEQRWATLTRALSIPFRKMLGELGRVGIKR
jgi:hypothetical protein